MKPNSVSFHNFEIENPDLYLNRVLSNAPCFWPEDWTLVFAVNDMAVNIFTWTAKNCTHEWDMGNDIDGSITAFESDEEATLFIMTF